MGLGAARWRVACRLYKSPPNSRLSGSGCRVWAPISSCPGRPSCLEVDEVHGTAWLRERHGTYVSHRPLPRCGGARGGCVCRRTHAWVLESNRKANGRGLGGFEPRSLDSESRVLTVTPRGRLSSAASAVSNATAHAPRMRACCHHTAAEAAAAGGGR